MGLAFRRQKCLDERSTRDDEKSALVHNTLSASEGRLLNEVTGQSKVDCAPCPVCIHPCNCVWHERYVDDPLEVGVCGPPAVHLERLARGRLRIRLVQILALASLHLVYQCDVQKVVCCLSAAMPSCDLVVRHHGRDIAEVLEASTCLSQDLLGFICSLSCRKLAQDLIGDLASDHDAPGADQAQCVAGMEGGRPCIVQIQAPFLLLLGLLLCRRWWL
mmetsp:Transcript_78015/g.187021  ORF Transcript_78015/g.187021 Transcript_78015/m.187021 type:complete len:218 (-) Transcript_78015:1008-1661(-)